jgi:hypothetical protein
MTTTLFVAEVLRYFIGFLMLAAATGKLRTFADFRANLAASFGMSAALSSMLAPAIVVAECAVSVLVLSAFSRSGMLASLLMLCAFTAVISYKFFTQAVVKCSCFGEAGRSVSGFDLLRNLLVILSIAVYLLIAAGAGLPLQMAVLAAALASILCVMAIEFHDIVTMLVKN